MDISVVSPFYNEGKIVGSTVRDMLDQLESLDGDWELIVVNDGSTDESGEAVKSINHPRLRLIEYPVNRGRGYALAAGIQAARGDIIVTTEIDLSWGENIVHELVAEMHRNPGIDFVVASPHLPGGTYKNVPLKRVFFSKFGNRIIRTLMSRAATMNTGMTRAYRRGMIQSLPLYENGKEFHLEVILKATALGYRFSEIPAVLEWKDYRDKGKKVVRKSSSKVKRLIVSHTLFSIFANPVRYAWGGSIISLLAGIGFFTWAVTLYLSGDVAVYNALMGLLLVVLAIVLFMMGVVLQQGNMIQREVWLLQQGRKSTRFYLAGPEEHRFEEINPSHSEP